jgi:hypothetical protein
MATAFELPGLMTTFKAGFPEPIFSKSSAMTLVRKKKAKNKITTRTKQKVEKCELEVELIFLNIFISCWR